MSNSEVDAAFLLLPRHVRDCVDEAFDSAIEQSGLSSKKARDAHELSPRSGGGGFVPTSSSAGRNIAQGGFVIDEPQAGGFVVDEPQAGGFVLDSDEDPNERPSRIPLSLIPAALQLLDLQPDDEDVLQVFRNAASGWDSKSRDDVTQADLFVERKDWHAVCTALLESADREEEEGDQDIDMDDNPQREEEESSPSGDEYEYVGEDEAPDYDEDANDSDDEYREASSKSFNAKRKGKETSKSRPRRTKQSAAVSDSGEEDASRDATKRVTPRQRAECRRTYALFFPDVADEDLDSQRLMIKDITRVAKVLREKVTAEEIIEMLEAFSTTADKSMNLGDFERMMIAAKLA
ncbi:hypothetical protein EUX98_g5610 [Antrodiella citrinella]|uniref:EF-hand domain-containing protein n=1 Tax=Antrodiella citrinella TaxID=2447956 RepID=A0A4S4MRC4_9APHY|nr:hypothetical protein EUX98_g5610 [Antrodiella citrinella]